MVRMHMNAARIASRQFSSSAPRSSFARLTVAGNLVEAPKKSLTQKGKPFWIFKIATSDPRPPPNADAFPDASSSFHTILAFNDVEYWGTIPKGSLVHADAQYSIKSEKIADGEWKDSVNLKLESLKVLKKSKAAEEESGSF